MGNLARKIGQRSRGVGGLNLPDGYDASVRRVVDFVDDAGEVIDSVEARGADAGEVRKQAIKLSEQFSAAEDPYVAAVLSGDTEAAEQIIAPLANLVDSYAKEARAAPQETVVADLTAALLSIDDDFRKVILSQANDPGIFGELKTFRQRKNAIEPDEELATQAKRESKAESAGKRTPATSELDGSTASVVRRWAETRGGVTNTERDRHPMMGRMSMVFARTTDGKPKAYDNLKPRPTSALDDTADPNEPGISEKTKKSRQDKRDYQLQTLAGDQVAEVKQIEKRTGKPAILPPVRRRSVAESRRQLDNASSDAAKRSSLEKRRAAIESLPINPDVNPIDDVLSRGAAERDPTPDEVAARVRARADQLRKEGTPDPALEQLARDPTFGPAPEWALSPIQIADDEMFRDGLPSALPSEDYRASLLSRIDSELAEISRRDKGRAKYGRSVEAKDVVSADAPVMFDPEIGKMVPAPEGDVTGTADRIMTVGTGYNPSSPTAPAVGGERASWKGKRAQGRSIDYELENRNSEMISRKISVLERRTDPNSPVYMKTIDLDAYFPWWRSRVADIDPDGNYVYPDEYPTAEFITHMIAGMYNVGDPDFVRRTTPLIRASMEAAPEVIPNPVSRVTFTKEDLAAMTPEARAAARDKMSAYRQDYRRFNTARKQERTLYTPSDTLRETLQRYRQAGATMMQPGSKEFTEFMDARNQLYGDSEPFGFYSGKPMKRPPVAGMEPAAQPQATPASTYTPTEAEKARAEELRARRKKKADSGDQASIYSVPDSSPLYYLMA